MSKRAIAYIKENLLGILIGFAVITFIWEGLILPGQRFTITGILTLVIFTIAAQHKYSRRSLEQKALKKRGLTHQDLTNIDFVKNWEPVQQDGLIKFCFIQGGLTVGLIIFPLLLLAFIYLVFFSVNISFYTGIVYPLGAACVLGPYLLGVIVYGVRYQLNQRRFQRLTDPLKLKKPNAVNIF